MNIGCLIQGGQGGGGGRHKGHAAVDFGSLACMNTECLIQGGQGGGGWDTRGRAAMNMGMITWVLGFGGSEALQMCHKAQRMCTATKVPADAKMLLRTQL